MRPKTSDPTNRPGRTRAWLGAIALLGALPAAFSLAVFPGVARAAPPAIITLLAHRFTPDHLVVPAGKRFHFLVTSRDTTPDTFASPSLGVEKPLRPGQTIGVWGGPLAPGRYGFYEVTHPHTAKGTVEVR